jgi:hypothetical protein
MGLSDNFLWPVNAICSGSRFTNEESEMVDENGAWTRQSETF